MGRMRLPYAVVDVFATAPLTGNPLTIIDARGVKNLTAEWMQKLASETNHSETTFLVGMPGHVRYPEVRIFTPTTELPFAGHPTLGTAWFANHEGTIHGLDLPGGRFEVQCTPAGGTLEAGEPKQLEAATPSDWEGVLNVEVEVSEAWDAGLSIRIVRLHSLEDLGRAKLVGDLDDLPGKGHGCLAYVQGKDGIRCRFFAPDVGVQEDPATGSANAALAAHLAALHGADIDVVSEQGLEMGRPSRLRLRASPGKRPRISGDVVQVATGTFEFELP